MTYYYQNDPIAELVVHLATHGPQDKLKAALKDPRGPLDAGFPALFAAQGNHPQWMTVDLAREALKARPSLALATAQDGSTALHVAIEGHLAGGATIVDELLKAGADPLREDAEGYNPLDRACQAPDGTGLSGAKIQQTWPEQEAILNLLIDRVERDLSEDQYALDLFLANALRWAAHGGKLRNAAHLIERGAEPAPDLTLDDEGPASALELAADINELDLEDKYQDQLIQLILNAMPKDQLVEHLANRDGDVTDVLPKGPLRAAANEGRTNVLKLLVQHGATDRPAWKGMPTALMDAAWSSHEDAVAFLLKGDPSNGLAAPSVKYINNKDEDGNTALHYVFLEEMGMDEDILKPIVRDLLEAGADPRIKNKEGETPMALARGREEDTLVQLMEEVAARLGPLKKNASKARINTESFDKGVAAPRPTLKKFAAG